MADLTTSRRDRLQDRSFAYVAPAGERKLPINDAAHVRNAIARFGQTEFDGAAAKRRAARRIVAAAQRHDIEIDPSDDVARAAGRGRSADRGGSAESS